MTKQAKQLVSQVRASRGIKRVPLQTILGLDDAAFEAAVTGAGQRIIRVRGQNGGFFPA